jgi:beta-glucanase (GH16 family)
MEIPIGDRSQSLAVLHYGADNNQYFHWEDGDFTQWHTFALEWQPSHVTLYIDGEEIVTWDDPDAIPRDPMHLAIQNDVGPHDGFIPARDETTPDEVSLEVDWVRIYAP